MNINEDIDMAKDLINIKGINTPLFTDTSAIYKTTNENMNDNNYINLIKNNRSMLSVIGSGDQILNSILYDSYNIDAFDVSRFPKYFLELKIAAIKTLTYEEYLAFFYDNNTFNRKLYKKIVSNMKGDSKIFWDNIANYNKFFVGKDEKTPNNVYNSKLFVDGDNFSSTAKKNNPYLTRSKYNLLKIKLDIAKINYIDGNIFNIAKTINKSYDLINLSNICMYQPNMYQELNKNSNENKFKTFITNLKLNPDGKVLNYLMGYTPGSFAHRYVDKYYLSDPDFKVMVIDNGNTLDDALIVYQKRK